MSNFRQTFILTVIIAICIMPIIVHAKEFRDNTEIKEELQVDNLEISDIAEFNYEQLNNILANAEHDDSPLMKELDMFSAILPRIITVYEGIPDIGDKEPTWSYSISDDKLVDIIEDGNGNIFGIMYSSNQTICFSGEIILEFLYENIRMATGLQM